MEEPSPYTLRPARADECVALSELCLRSKAHWGYDEAFIEACREELKVPRQAVEAGRVCVAADAKGAALGVAEIVIDDDAHIEKLFVEPAAMGRGVGAALFQWLRDRARNAKATTLVIESDPDAAPFYRRMGAVDDGTAPSGSIPGRFLPRLKLVLDEK